MNDSTISLPWLVIRQDDNGNRYRVGRYATRAEAQKIADSLDSRGHKQLYWVERIGQSQGQAQAQAQNGDGTLN
ncbi:MULTISPECIES: SPOR domain-containing protein [unclassified Streptomyces]|uniref:SPOR domain-containing protein n=1 Tax=Streptomyces TaxID=1883 RepID=UPI00224F19C3|nr:MULTISPECIES: SPOR domain-containing protein [unclassified Streptomyces]MCX5368207.1 SPOR domain-containing protein [Streptomyces sp. NBC_00103]